MIMNRPANNQNRGGFTLIELLMVVAIVAFLITLTTAAMNGITVQAEVDATTTTVLKVNQLLQQRVEAFDRSFRGPQRDSYITATVNLLLAVDGRFEYFLTHPDEAPPAIKLLAYKAAFRYEVPQRMVELNVLGGDGNGNGIPDVVEQKLAIPIARQQLIDAGTPSPTQAEITAKVNTNWAIHLAHETDAIASDVDSVHSTESAELLYFALTQWGTLGSSSAALDQFTASEIADTDGDGFPEFVDAWGNPLRFYRWPTRLFDPTAPNPFIPNFSDPSDVTEVDPTPDDDESDGLREILALERTGAGLLIKGLPPSPTQIATATQRDMLLVDPDDPAGILYTFIEDPKYIDMGIALTSEYNEANYHTPDTFHVPLIVSAGPDETLGLREPGHTDAAAGIYGNLAQYAETTANPGSQIPSSAVTERLFDNLTNRNRRAGARR